MTEKDKEDVFLIPRILQDTTRYTFSLMVRTSVPFSSAGHEHGLLLLVVIYSSVYY